MTKKEKGEKKKGSCLKTILVVALALFAISFIASMGDDNSESRKTESKQEIEKENLDEPESEEPESKEQEEQEEVDANGWTEDDKITFMTIVQAISDEYLADYKSPWSINDWTFSKFDNEGKVVATTKYTLKEYSEKQPVMCVFTWNPEDESYRGHYLAVGNSVYIDDGSCDEFFENLANIAESMNG